MNIIKHHKYKKIKKKLNLHKQKYQLIGYYNHLEKYRSIK